MPQAAPNGFSSAPKEGSSPELAPSRSELRTHWLRAQYGSVGSSNGHRSPVRSLAISIPDEDAGYKEGKWSHDVPFWHLCYCWTGHQSMWTGPSMIALADLLLCCGVQVLPHACPGGLAGQALKQWQWGLP